MSFADHLDSVKQRIACAAEQAGRDPRDVTLVAVSKRHGPERVAEAHAAGCRDLGENYVQELVAKQEAVDLEVRWHYIGGLQRNKCKQVVGRVALIHGVDSKRLADALSRAATSAEVVQDVLLQVNLGGESQKHGLPARELEALVHHVRSLPGLHLRGLMTVPPAVDDAEKNRPLFRRLAELAHTHELTDLSMGMSQDFEVAVAEGATLVRVGTDLFGRRIP